MLCEHQIHCHVVGILQILEIDRRTILEHLSSIEILPIMVILRKP